MLKNAEIHDIIDMSVGASDRTKTRINDMYNFIVNKRSGRNRGENNLNILTSYCNAKGYDYSVYETNARGHAMKLTEMLCRSGADNVIAIGGDGTFHEVVNGITDFEKVKVGFIPSGRGNDFARAASLPLKPLEAFEDIIAGETKRIDYIDVGARRCLNIGGTGMDVDVLKAVDGKRNAFTYYTSLVRCLMRFDPYHVTVRAKTADGGEIELVKDCIMVGVCNGSDFGGGMHIAPGSSINDGVLDLMIAEKLNRGPFGILSHFVKGRHHKLPEITHYNVTEVTVDGGGCPIELDGEIYEGISLDCKVIRSGLVTYKTKKEREGNK